MGYSAKIIIKKDSPKKDGTYPIKLRVTIDRKPRNFPINHFTKIEHWNESTGRVTREHPLFNRLNLLLSEKQNKANQIFIDLEINKKQITHKAFEMMYLNNVDGCFFKYAEKQTVLMKAKFSHEYTRHLDTYINKIRAFRSELKLNEIDVKFLKDYEHHLRSKGNRQNTIHTNIKFIRKIINEAISEELLDKSPFGRNKYQLKEEKSNREYLNPEELKKLEQLLDYNIPHYLKNILIWFLLACYTGWRFRDLKDIDQWRIYEDHARIISHKTKTESIIFFNSRIKNVFGLLDTGNYKLPSNQKSNDYIKEVVKLAGIKKHITFHCGRHTFATINGMIGVDFQVISNLLGHQDLKSTQRYKRTPSEVLQAALMKWNDI